MSFARYLRRRLLLLIPQVLGVVTLTFVIVRVLPGNPATTIAGPISDPATIASITYFTSYFAASMLGATVHDGTSQ